jgi:sulfate permease, SulP family
MSKKVSEHIVHTRSSEPVGSMANQPIQLLKKRRSMIPLERMLVALSATEADVHLLKYAQMLASMGLGKQYDFVHVRTPARKAQEPESDNEVLRRCQESVDAFFAPVENDVARQCHVIEGVRVDSLIDFIASRHCDIALVGHRSTRSGQRSLAKRLAMIAPCSVWLVPDGAPVSLTNIMMPVDFSENSADSVGVATSIAKTAGLSECLAVHIFSDPSIIRYDEHIDELRSSEHESYNKFVAPIDRHGITVEPAFVEGNNVSGTILYTAKRHGADLLVMNTRGRSRAASILLGSVTTQVMVDSPVAVLAVKHAGASLTLFQALKENKPWRQANPKTN